MVGLIVFKFIQFLNIFSKINKQQTWIIRDGQEPFRIERRLQRGLGHNLAGQRWLQEERSHRKPAPVCHAKVGAAVEHMGEIELVGVRSTRVDVHSGRVESSSRRVGQNAGQ